MYDQNRHSLWTLETALYYRRSVPRRYRKEFEIAPPLVTNRPRRCVALQHQKKGTVCQSRMRCRGLETAFIEREKNGLLTTVHEAVINGIQLDQKGKPAVIGGALVFALSFCGVRQHEAVQKSLNMADLGDKLYRDLGLTKRSNGQVLNALCGERRARVGSESADRRYEPSDAGSNKGDIDSVNQSMSSASSSEWSSNAARAVVANIPRNQHLFFSSMLFWIDDSSMLSRASSISLLVGEAHPPRQKSPPCRWLSRW